MSETDQRDILWSSTYETYYDTYYAEILLEALIKKWMKLDVTTKIIVSITASGSAIVGWSLWHNPDYKIFWAAIAGTGAILTILNSAFSVPNLLKQHTNNQNNFQKLRLELETFRHEMNYSPQFNFDEFKDRFLNFRKRYTELFTNTANDLICTEKLKNFVQDKLDCKLKDEIES